LTNKWVPKPTLSEGWGYGGICWDPTVELRPKV